MPGTQTESYYNGTPGFPELFTRSMMKEEWKSAFFAWFCGVLM